MNRRQRLIRQERKRSKTELATENVNLRTQRDGYDMLIKAILMLNYDIMPILQMQQEILLVTVNK